MSLGEKFPDTLSVGMEIRDKVVEYVEQRLEKLRSKEPNSYGNIGIVHTNAMRYLPNYFEKGQVIPRMFSL